MNNSNQEKAMPGETAAIRDDKLYDSSLFKHWSSVNLRFGDTDALGHINNAVYASLFESGRFAFCEMLFKDANKNGNLFTLARVVINFRREMLFPGVAEVGTRILASGRTSITLGQTLYKDGILHATSDSVIVHVDGKARRPAPLGGDLLERFNTLL